MELTRGGLEVGGRRQEGERGGEDDARVYSREDDSGQGRRSTE